MWQSQTPESMTKTDFFHSPLKFAASVKFKNKLRNDFFSLYQIMSRDGCIFLEQKITVVMLHKSRATRKNYVGECVWLVW